MQKQQQLGRSPQVINHCCLSQNRLGKVLRRSEQIVHTTFRSRNSYIEVSIMNYPHFRFPKLRTVHLESNGLLSIPGEVLELKNLTRLDLSDNKITQVAPEIKELIK